MLRSLISVFMGILASGLVCATTYAAKPRVPAEAAGFAGSLEGVVKEKAPTNGWIVLSVRRAEPDAKSKVKDGSVLASKQIPVSSRLAGNTPFPEQVAYIATLKVGDKVTLKVRYNDNAGNVAIRLAEVPAGFAAPGGAVGGATTALPPRVAEAGPQAPQSVLGNIFLDTEPLVLQCIATGGSVDYTIKDFWGQTVAGGKAPVVGGVATIKPDIKKRGYFELTAGAQELTFAVVAPVDIKKLSDSPFNVCSHFSMGWSTELVPLMARVGVSEVRDNVGWGGVEKAKGSYDYSGKAREWIAACRQAGIKVLATGGCMGNKLYGGGFPETAEARLAYGKFTADMGRHYGNALSGLELWNEFNGTWGPKNKSANAVERGKIYAEMSKIAYPEIKKACPSSPVLGCATVVMPAPYLESVFKSEGLSCMDGVVIHPYIPLPENLWRDIGAVRELIKKYNRGKEKPIYATEYGWASWNTDNPPQIGKFLVRGSVIMNAQNVRSMHWYQFQDEPGFMSMGLVHTPNDAHGKYSPSPALAAYATLVRALGAAKFEARELNMPYTSAWVFRFRDGKDEVRACWSSGDDKPQISLESDKPLTKIDLMGNESQIAPQDGRIVLALDETPFFLKGRVKSVREIPSPWKSIADSRDDFGEMQGINNWRLGYYDGQGGKPSQTLKPSAFREMTVTTTAWGYEWHGGAALIKLGVMVAGGKSWPATRWQSPVEGRVTLRGYFEAKDKKNPATVATAIYVDGKSAYAHELNNQKDKFEVAVDVKKGSTVDFVAATDGPKGRCPMQAAICVKNSAFGK